jgi:hypothetical protein
MSDAVEEIDYLEQARGPGIPELAAGDRDTPAPPEELEPSLYPGWDLETIETFLSGTGAGIHMLIGQTEQDWLLTEKDLERIAPPLTRIANRWEPALRLSPVADPLLVAHGMALYGWRSALEMKRAKRDAEEEPEGPAVSYERGPADTAPDSPELAEPGDPRYFDQGDSHQ